MSKVIHFEVHTTDPQRAMKFYGELFDWKFEKYEKAPMEYWMIMAGEKDEPGANGGLFKRMEPMGPKEGAPANAYVCTIGVDSTDATIARVKELGGTVMMGKTPIAGMGWLAYFVDTEGNGFGVMQPDPDAK